MAEINDFNVTDASNTGRWPENMAPSAMNDAARADEGILARWYQDTNGSLTSTGSSNTYALSINSTATVYNGQNLVFEANHANTGAATLNVTNSGGSAQGALAIVWPDGSALASGDIPSGARIHVIYEDDNTRWQLHTAASPPSSDLVNDTTPQLGGDLDTNSFNVQFDDAHGIQDDSGNEQITFTKTASAVNEVTVTNAATGSGPSIAATGDDTNIDLTINPKGTGNVVIDGLRYPETDGSNGDVVTTDGSGNLTLSAPTGGDVQQNETLKTDTASASVATGTWADISGMSVTLTGVVSGARVEIDGALSLGCDAGARVYYRVLRGTTPVAVGDAASNRQQGLGGVFVASSSDIEGQSFSIQDTGHGGGSVTYKIQWAHEDSGSRTLYLNRSGADGDTSRTLRGASRIAATEKG